MYMKKMTPKQISLANDVWTGMTYTCHFKTAKVEWNDKDKSTKREES